MSYWQESLSLAVLKYESYTVSLRVDFPEQSAKKIRLSPELAGGKIRNWCAYQERSQQETRNKLFEYGLYSEDVEQIIASLIEENYLNEERFALALAGGKFRIKQWGRIKIKIELKKHKVPEFLVNKALRSIDAEAYSRTLQQVLQKKLGPAWQGDRKKKQQAFSYALSRGFESDLITENLNQLLEK